MTVHDIRALLARDKPTVGTWLQLPSTDVAELMARAGYDWVAVDMEHGSFGRTGLPDIFRAIRPPARGCKKPDQVRAGSRGPGPDLSHDRKPGTARPGH